MKEVDRTQSSIEDKISAKSEMTTSEREFLYGLLKIHRPRKILEIGVAAGAGSIVLLQAVRDDQEALVYSMDLAEKHYSDPSKLTGYLVEEMTPELLNRWHLYTGKLCYAFLEQLGMRFDFVVLDTAHYLPGEALDYIMFHPFLAKNALLVIHDIGYSQVALKKRKLRKFKEHRDQNACLQLLSVLKGQKIYPPYTEYPYFPNIAAIRLPEAIDENIDNIFSILSLPWSNRIQDEYALREISPFLRKYYGAERAKKWENILDFQAAQLDYEKELKSLWGLARIACKKYWNSLNKPRPWKRRS